MKVEQVLKRVIELCAMVTDATEINADSEIVDDLAISSMDVMFLVSSLEDEFQVHIAERQIRTIITVGDIADMIVIAVDKKAN